jgi:hypothetical protein
VPAWVEVILSEELDLQVASAKDKPPVVSVKLAESEVCVESRGR